MTRELKILGVVWRALIICHCGTLSCAATAQTDTPTEKPAGNQANQSQSATEIDARRIAIVGQEEPLRVPVYPRNDSEDKPLPKGADLRDQYILLDDGSVLSMADWILGALKKNDIYSEMSDAERRIFLGEVARSMAQKGRLLGARPGFPLPAPKSLEEPLPERPVGIFANRLPYLFTSPDVPTIANGIMKNNGIHVFNDSLGTSDPAELNGGKIALLPDPLAAALDWHREDWQYRGAQLKMLDEFVTKQRSKLVKGSWGIKIEALSE